MSNQITGVIKLINPTQTFDSGFQKREFVVTTKEQYPQDIKIEVVKDKDKYYVSLQAWKIAASGEDAPSPVADEDPENLPF